MTSLSLAVPGELNWSKIPHQSGFELKQNGEILARLQKPKFWSCSMRVEVDVLPRRFLAQHYRGYRRGLEGHTCPLDAKLERGWNADVQRRADFSGVAPVVLELVWAVKSANGQLVTRIHSRRKRAELFSKGGVSGSRAILLALLAWQCIKQQAEDAASAAIVVAAS
jgi:hypothetical protein